MQEPRLRDSECFAQGHSAGKGQSQDLNPGLTDSKPKLFPVRVSCRQIQGLSPKFGPSWREAKTYIYWAYSMPETSHTLFFCALHNNPLK